MIFTFSKSDFYIFKNPKKAVLDDVIEYPAFILTIVRLLPCVLVPDAHQRTFLQVKILREIRRLFLSQSNLSSMNENHLVRGQLIGILMDAPYVQYIKEYITPATNRSLLSETVFQLFETILVYSS